MTAVPDQQQARPDPGVAQREASLDRKASRSHQNYAIYDLTPDDSPDGIHAAAAHGDCEGLLRTLERSSTFDVDELDRYGRTALHWAADVGNMSAVEALLDAGANPMIAEVNGRSSIHLAARKGHAEVIVSILKRVKDANEIDELVNASDDHGMTPVFLARARGQEGEEAFKVLMSRGANYMTRLTDVE